MSAVTAAALSSALSLPAALRPYAQPRAPAPARRSLGMRARASAGGPSGGVELELPVTRREVGKRAVALAAAAAVAPVLPMFTPASAAAELQVFEAIEGERWAPLAATFELPADWKARPGQKPKPGKFLLYTDTYGPNYRYFANWPKLKDATDLVVDSIEVVVLGRAGLEGIADLGTIKQIDPQRGFGLGREDLTQGPEADVLNSNVRTDKSGQQYYEWELKTGDGNTVLVSATASAGAIYALAIGATPEQYARVGDSLKATQQTFSVARAEESTVDLSGRIYGTKKAGGFN